MRGAGHVAQRDTHTETAAISAHTGMHPHSSIDRGNQRSRAEGFIRNTYINKYLHNRDILRENTISCNKARKVMKPVLLGFVLIKGGLYWEEVRC